MGFLKKKISTLVCSGCDTKIGIQCGSCHRPLPPENYNANRSYICNCGAKCNQLTCPICGHTDDPWEFSCGSEIGITASDPRSSYPLGKGS